MLVAPISTALKAGVIVARRIEKTTKRCFQGSPLSPMLSNIVLHERNHELERRSFRYCCWADDLLILLRFETITRRVLEVVAGCLEEELKLSDNRKKSQAAQVKGGCHIDRVHYC